MSNADISEFKMIELANGEFSLFHQKTGEVFHPGVGAENEFLNLYLKPMDIESRFEKASSECCLWDVGLGAGGNILNFFHQTRSLKAAYKVVSFDFDFSALQFALLNQSHLPYLKPYISQVDTFIRTGKVTFQNGMSEVCWTFQQGDFREIGSRFALNESAPHAIFYDPYSPKKNPSMWSLDHFARLRSLMQHPCTLATYSRSTCVRVSLLLSGWFVGRGGETEVKEENTVASTHLALLKAPLEVDWLDRVRNSTNAEPLKNIPHVPGRASDQTWQELHAHPQFQSISASSKPV